MSFRLTVAFLEFQSREDETGINIGREARSAPGVEIFEEN